MQITSSTNLYQPQLQDASKETKREVATDIAGHKSKQAQIDAYVAGTQNANENYNDIEDTQNSTQNYMEFSSDLRKAEGYATLVENGVNPLDIANRPSIQPIENPIDKEDLSDSQTDALRGVVTDVAGYKSTKAQIEAYAAGSAENGANPYNSYEDTQDYIQNYNDFAQQVRRSEYVNTYIQNNTSQFA